MTTGIQKSFDTVIHLWYLLPVFIYIYCMYFIFHFHLFCVKFSYFWANQMDYTTVQNFNILHTNHTTLYTSTHCNTVFSKYIFHCAQYLCWLNTSAAPGNDATVATALCGDSREAVWLLQAASSLLSASPCPVGWPDAPSRLDAQGETSVFTHQLMNEGLCVL